MDVSVVCVLLHGYCVWRYSALQSEPYTDVRFTIHCSALCSVLCVVTVIFRYLKLYFYHVLTFLTTYPHTRKKESDLKKNISMKIKERQKYM